MKEDELLLLISELKTINVDSLLNVSLCVVHYYVKGLYCVSLILFWIL